MENISALGKWAFIVEKTQNEKKGICEGMEYKEPEKKNLKEQPQVTLHPSQAHQTK